MPDNLRRVGVTATREGLTEHQVSRAAELLFGVREWSKSAPEIHHGDCVGGDEELHKIAYGLGYRTVMHPPTVTKYRAWTQCHAVMPRKPYLDRNRDIVDATDILLAFPKESEESRFGGTWYTVRYARQVGRRLVIVWPHGGEGLDDF